MAYAVLQHRETSREKRKHGGGSHLSQRHGKSARSPQGSERKPGGRAADCRRPTVWLVDADERRSSLTLKVSSGAKIGSLESALRAHWGSKQKDVPAESSIHFYRGGRQLQADDRLSEDAEIKYKITVPGRPSTVEVLLQGCDGAESNLSDTVREALGGTGTLEELRHLVASSLGVGDSYRVSIKAISGARDGGVEGDDWLLGKARDFHFRTLQVELLPEDAYLVLTLHGRRYIYHPTRDQRQAVPQLADIARWLRRSFLSTVHPRHTSSRVRVRASDIGLRPSLSEGGDPRDLRWGDTVDLDLPPLVTEQFLDEESWLLADTAECNICCEPKKVTQMPLGPVTAECNGVHQTCRPCLRQWLETSVETSGSEALRCPDCSSIMRYEDIRHHATPEAFSRYDRQLTVAALRETENFHWCLSPSCNSGQISNDDCNRFTCVTCQAKHCTQHQVVWHKGESCEQYDLRHQRHRRDDQASEAEVRRTSKPCPNCRKVVHKFEGCNHITCICRHEWCYLCLKPYTHDRIGILLCRHANNCPERSGDPRLIFGQEDLGDVPGPANVGERFRPPPGGDDFAHFLEDMLRFHHHTFDGPPHGQQRQQRQRVDIPNPRQFPFRPAPPAPGLFPHQHRRGPMGPMGPPPG